MRLKINPTRMQLLRLRRRIDLARRGHQLLQDRLDGLLQNFFRLKDDYLQLHARLEPELTKIFLTTVMGSALSHPKAFDPANQKKAQAEVAKTQTNIMGVKTVQWQLKQEGDPSYNELVATGELMAAAGQFSQRLPELVRLAGLSQTLKAVASQIIETRRRVNALEYILIPELARNVKLIKIKLAELERSTKVVLIKLGE
ncbi:hypothetical protein A2311_02010 [candidate division WOR-1 bacterium RIFOXYB2_FULL_48_7]|uniref:V-type ATP synthase subunit D n=1 Tax=candidate division WOR-1 bacterium RIFOXYB2_FULL_48_7 TaxID=1802583 RepID=A0A1F4TVV3_UNCSA|nr:MAG: hypothetical protein A2311_02010 [candidate division WOR-1 bacterium RIFOXYB2_FULL_48_7]